MTERVLTPEKLIELIEASPNNPKANSAGVLRSGKQIEVLAKLDIEALTTRINNWFKEASCRT
ncbi:hypothetical protein [Reyranella sp.]|uniref:hypothetical protein n=1 Tax=Reyranella sp. TaxID=1929291 RepID=UPI00121FFF18|nr:hypothetical protein [Reyranella sp.]TAJ89683.1 MAG: hypothetical protein EPO50_04790 [Reyranella sp.]